MPWRTKLGALLGAGGLILMAASTTMAAGGGSPTYTISVSKSASPTAVPPSGGTVVFTVHVTGTGTGFFQTVSIVDTMAGCTLGAPTGDDGDSKLEQGETWNYSCSVNNVMPQDSNTATVNACHNLSACNNSTHDATGTGSVTLDQGAATDAPPTDAPPTDAPPTDAPPTDAPPTDAPPTDAPPTNAPPTDAPPTPSQGVGDLDATQPVTDTIDAAGAAGGPDRSILLVLSLGMLLASLVLITPARPVRARQRQ